MACRMTGQGEWPIGACSWQLVRRLAASYTHKWATLCEQY